MQQERGSYMATSTFERKIEIKDQKSLKKLMDILSAEVPVKPLSQHPFCNAQRDRSEKLLKQCLSHSVH